MHGVDPSVPASPTPLAPNGLQGVGVHIWDSLEQPRSIADLCASIRAEFDVSEDDCRADVAQILASLQAEQLVETRG